MSQSINWGIIATGAIADCFARNLKTSRTGKLVAIASRSAEGATKFGEKHGIPVAKRYASYDAILADKDVQAVYIAPPHPAHAEWAIKAAEAGKHLLVEKPLAVNQYDAQAIIEAAIVNNVFLMEAFMYRCHPQTARLVELIKNKEIGDVRVIQATFSFHAGFNADGRTFNNDLAGGGILDVGCYTTSMARLIAGAATGADFADPVDVKGTAHLGTTGVDEYAIASLKFPGNIIAQLATGVGVNQENVLRIFGTSGRIVVPNPWVANRNGPDVGKIIVHRNGKDAEEIICPTELTAFTMEADVFGDAVLAGKKQAPAPAMTWADTLGNLRTLDAWRSSIGLTYNQEKPEHFRKTTVAAKPLKVSSASIMKYGQIPYVNKKVSRLVMGVDNQYTFVHAAAIFDAFFEQGGNTFDTAFIYAGGQNERMLGHWIKHRGVRNEVVVIAKGGHTPECYPGPIARQLKTSLERMQIEGADLYMMHRDNLEVPAGEFVDVLNEQVKAGRIKAFGGSNWSIARVAEANEYAAKRNLQGFSIISNNFSLARMVDAIWGGCIAASDPESRAFLTKTQLTLLPWSSQARGFFTDRAHRDKALNDAEMNRVWYAEDNWQRRDRVLEMAAKKNVLPINIALAYVLCQPFPTFPLIGPRTLEELRTSLPGLSIELTPDEVKWLNLEA